MQALHGGWVSLGQQYMRHPSLRLSLAPWDIGIEVGCYQIDLAERCWYFFDNAIFFAFAMQIASIVTLARANFGISADGVGATTMKIAWVVSTLTLLPLLPLVLRPQLFNKEMGAEPLELGPSKNVLAPMNDNCTMPDNERFGRQSSRAKAREDQRFLLFVSCWALSFYPFFSRKAGTFGEQLLHETTDCRLIPR
jgi:hypothetical protein